MSGYWQYTCEHPGCQEEQVQSTPNYANSGEPGYRKWCKKHYEQRRAKNAGAKTTAEYLEKLAKKQGFESHTEKKNSIHPYRQYRKDYCENRDGRLGYKCNCKIHISAQLQVDHIDGDPSNNDPSNLQTLCANCHIYKTHAKKDFATPGRRTLKEAGHNVYA